MKIITENPNSVVPDFLESDLARYAFLVHIKQTPNEYIGMISQELDSTFRLLGEVCNSTSTLIWFDGDHASWNRCHEIGPSLLNFIQYTWNKYERRGYDVTIFIAETENDATTLITRYGIRNQNIIARLITM